MKYLPIKRIVALTPKDECQDKCDRMNKANPDWHFKPRKESGAGYQIVGAKRNV